MARNYFVTPKWQYSKSVTARARRATKTLENALGHMWNTAAPHPMTGLQSDDWNTEAAHLIEAAVRRVWLAHDYEQKDAKLRAEITRSSGGVTTAPAPETPAPDAMPEIQVGDWLLLVLPPIKNKTVRVRRLLECDDSHVTIETMEPNDLGGDEVTFHRVTLEEVRGERNGLPFIWRRQEAQP